MKKETRNRKARQRVRKIIDRALKQKGKMHDLAIHTRVIMTLTREEMRATYRYHDMIRFISAIDTYDEILFALRKDRTKWGKNTFHNLLKVRNKIAREWRTITKKREGLFKELRVDKLKKNKKNPSKTQNLNVPKGT